jgi:fructose 1,6-bisphosphate aldolase/phosphatase
MKTTISVIKADIGGYVGHSAMHPELVEKANEELKKVKGKLLMDYHVAYVGDDLDLIMTHKNGCDNSKVHKLAWTIFEECTKIADRKSVV